MGDGLGQTPALLLTAGGVDELAGIGVEGPSRDKADMEILLAVDRPLLVGEGVARDRRISGKMFGADVGPRRQAWLDASRGYCNKIVIERA